MISKELTQELYQILKEDYGVDLSNEIVTHIGNSLVTYFEILLKTDNESSYKNNY